MAGAPTEVCLTHAGHRIDRSSVESRTDEELLAAFLQRGAAEAEEAFRALVVRHGPMVLGVCRHVLGRDHDAEDSFQAVFLVLARRAGTIRDRRLLASWLYEVAYRISVKARVEGVRRRARERQVVAMSDDSIDPHQDYDNNDAWNELRSVLQSEVDRLPEKYRAPVILCYLEGKTNVEAARILDWPIGSVKGRLARARDILHARLMRRNLVLSATFLLSALHRETVFAEVVPSSLVESSVRAGLSVVGKTPSKPSPISADALMLMESYVGPRTGRKLLAAVAAVALVAGLLGLASHSQTSGIGDRLDSFQVRFGQIIDTMLRSLPAKSTCASSQPHE
jgi:RNA polymerase sigma factor (sigma-70 family)